MKHLILITLSLVFLSQTGCASMGRKLKSFLSGGATEGAAPAPKSNVAKFSDNPNLPPLVRRHYKRTTKESLADEAALNSNSGSLWVMEGQGAYLFSQNIMRMIGDPIAVQMEGEPKEQMQTKVDVIRKLLAKLEERQQARLRGPANEEDGKEKGKKSDGKEGETQKPAAKDTAASQTGPNDKKEDTGVKLVPTRVVERTIDGNYRIKGSQPFMIGSREYKMIVTGVVRAEDFNDEGISATKLLDPKFDIVSMRRKEME